MIYNEITQHNYDFLFLVGKPKRSEGCKSIMHYSIRCYTEALTGLQTLNA